MANLYENPDRSLARIHQCDLLAWSWYLVSNCRMGIQQIWSKARRIFRIYMAASGHIRYLQQKPYQLPPIQILHRLCICLVR